MDAHGRILRRMLFRPGVEQTQALDWDALFQDELPRVFNFFRYRLADRDTAHDLTATTFERAWRQRHHFDPQQAQPGTWLLGIARNVWREYVRGREREYRRLAPLEAASIQSSPPHLIERLVAAEEQARLRALLAQLPEREQELIALKYGAGLTNRQIAALTGLSESNVGTILHRTVRKLRRQWEETNG